MLDVDDMIAWADLGKKRVGGNMVSDLVVESGS